MRRHLQAALPRDLDHNVLLTRSSVILIDADAQVQVPEVMKVPREFMTFDPSAWPSRVNYGDFVQHMRQDCRRNRIPEAFMRLSDDDLRSRAEWAVERARDAPNIVLTQWFWDKDADTGEPQIILPMTLDAPPSVNPRLGLVLQQRKENGHMIYNVKTALSLDMVFSNVMVFQPRGGHWLTLQHPDVQQADFLQHSPEDASDEDWERQWAESDL